MIVPTHGSGLSRIVGIRMAHALDVFNHLEQMRNHPLPSRIFLLLNLDISDSDLEVVEKNDRSENTWLRPEANVIEGTRGAWVSFHARFSSRSNTIHSTRSGHQSALDPL
jgi:hypothetical protein